MENHYSNSNRTNEDAIIEKIQGTVAAFRRERDELHRKKQLSTERLRLIREEKDSLEKTVDALKDRLSKLQAQTSSEAEKELGELEKKIQHLTREVLMLGICCHWYSLSSFLGQLLFLCL